MKVKIASLIFLEKQSENSMGTESLAHGTKKNPAREPHVRRGYQSQVMANGQEGARSNIDKKAR
jgi:hypothetical protein